VCFAVITLICVGRLKERFFAEGAAYYAARPRAGRSGYGRGAGASGQAQAGDPRPNNAQNARTGPAAVRIIEVPDESAPEGLSEAQKGKITEKEGRAILKQIGGAKPGRAWKPGPTVVALDVNGAKYTKADIDAIIRADENVVFVIGGSLGLGQNVLERADYRWSLSAMTLPHQLARVVVMSVV